MDQREIQAERAFWTTDHIPDWDNVAHVYSWEDENHLKWSRKVVFKRIFEGPAPYCVINVFFDTTGKLINLTSSYNDPH